MCLLYIRKLCSKSYQNGKVFHHTKCQNGAKQVISGMNLEVCILNRHINMVYVTFPEGKLRQQNPSNGKGVCEGKNHPYRNLTGEMNTCIHSVMSEYYISVVICTDSIC